MKTDTMKSDANVKQILQMDGVHKINIEEANKQVTHIPDLIAQYGTDSSWSHTVINSPSNSSTLICQLPGEGNRRHHHPDWDEWWYIIEGSWLWEIDNVTIKIKKGDVVFIERNKVHKITADGNSAAIRLAVSRYDVAHVYEPNDYE